MKLQRDEIKLNSPAKRWTAPPYARTSRPEESNPRNPRISDLRPRPSANLRKSKERTLEIEDTMRRIRETLKFLLDRNFRRIGERDQRSRRGIWRLDWKIRSEKDIEMEGIWGRNRIQKKAGIGNRRRGTLIAAGAGNRNGERVRPSEK